MKNYINLIALKRLKPENRILLNLLVVITIYLIMNGSVVTYNMTGGEESLDAIVEKIEEQERKISQDLLALEQVITHTYPDEVTSRIIEALKAKEETQSLALEMERDIEEYQQFKEELKALKLENIQRQEKLQRIRTLIEEKERN
jgi:muconolactone delta-isomerase